MRTKTKAQRVRREVVLNVAGGLMVGLLIFPVYWALCAAFQNDANFLTTTPDLFPVHPIWSNFAAAWDNEAGNVLTSLIVSSAVVAIGLLLGVPAAYGLRRFRVRYTTLVVVAMLVTQMVPSIVLSVSFYNVFRHIHLLNSYPGLILADSTYAVPLMVVLLRAHLQAVPDDLFESAIVDGCRELQVLRLVIIPVAVPGIITASVFGFLGAWGDFVFALTLNAGSSIQPVTVGLYKFFSTYSISWGPILATVCLAAIPAGIGLSVAQRWIRGGLRVGALKG